MRLLKPSRKVQVILLIFQMVVALSQIMANQIAFSRASSLEANLECSHVVSEAVWDPWGNIHFYNSYTIRNIGTTSVGNIPLRLPLEAEGVSAYDAGGLLNFAITNADDAQEISVTLRYPLRGNETGIFYYDAYTFMVSYRISSQIYLISTGSWIHHTLDFTLTTGLDLTIRSLVMRITLPEGASLQTSNRDGNISMNGLTQTIEYVFKDIDPEVVPSWMVEYEYLIFWAALRPILLVGAITLVISTLTFHRRRRKKPLPVISDKNINLIESFIENCDERIMLFSELDSLEDSLDDKAVRRKNYNRKKRTMQRRLRTLDNTLVNLKTKIRSIDRRYAELISKIDQAEISISALRGNIERFRAQRRSGRISRRSYTELKDSFENRLSRAKKAIESIIIELKGEI